MDGLANTAAAAGADAANAICGVMPPNAVLRSLII